MTQAVEGLVIDDACGVAVRRFDPMMFADDGDVSPEQTSAVKSETTDGDDSDQG